MPMINAKIVNNYFNVTHFDLKKKIILGMFFNFKRVTWRLSVKPMGLT